MTAWAGEDVDRERPLQQVGPRPIRLASRGVDRAALLELRNGALRRYLASYCAPSVVASGAPPNVEGRVIFTSTTLAHTQFPSFDATMARFSARARADDGAKWSLDCVVASTPAEVTSAKPARLEHASLANVFGDVLVPPTR